MNLSKNPIAGFIACPKCQRPSLVHFPKGGPRRKSPYLTCPEHGNQQNIARDYFVENALKTLPEFVEKHGETEHCTQLADVLNKQDPVINNDLLTLMHPIADDIEQPEEVQEPIQSKEDTDVKKAVTYDNEGNVIGEQSAQQSETPKGESSKSDGTIVIVVVLVAVVVLTGGYVVAKKIQRNKHIDNAGGE